jgi:hypothetical protein
MNFQTASNLFKNDQINKLAEDKDGLRFLKLRSLSRRDKLEQLAEEVGLNISRTPPNDLLKKLYDSRISEKKIESFIRRKFLEERIARKKARTNLSMNSISFRHSTGAVFTRIVLRKLSSITT